MSTSTGRVTAGRPNKIADDADGRFTISSRIGWLLRMNRLYGRDPDLAVARRCATAFPARSGHVTPGQISRWENGVLPVSYRMIRAYEDLLGLPPGHLTAAVDTVHQVRSVRAGQPRLDRQLIPDADLARDLDDLLDRCAGDAPVRGVDWDALSARVLAMPYVYLPRPVWGELVARLLREMSVSRGHAYLHRWEALRRLQGHSVAREAIAATVVEMVADPASQIVVDPLMLLVHDRQASQLLVDEIAAPTSERTLLAALEICELAADAGRFGGQDAAVLGQLARAYQADDGLHPQLQRAAADLVCSLVPGQERKASRGATTDRATSVAALVTSAEAALEVTTRGTATTENRMLTRLVGELLFSQQVDVRMGAAALLAASPFRTPLADALAEALTTRDQPLLGRWASALGTIGGAEHRAVLELLLLAPVPHDVVVQAAFSLGNLPGRTDTAVLARAVRCHVRRWRHARRDGTSEALRALVYAAGMQHATPVLSQVERCPELPAEPRAAARWWLARTPAGTE